MDSERLLQLPGAVRNQPRFDYIPKRCRQHRGGLLSRDSDVGAGRWVGSTATRPQTSARSCTSASTRELLARAAGRRGHRCALTRLPTSCSTPSTIKPGGRASRSRTGGLTEALADWAAKRVTDAAPIYTVAGEYIYHRAMSQFFEQVGSGLLPIQYPAHLFLHDQAAEHGDDRIKAILAAHLLSGRNADALGAADVRSNWHEFSKHLLNRPPWQRLQDTPQFPPDWELGPSHQLDVASDTYCSDPERMTMPPLSAQRVTIRLQARPEQLYLQVTSSGRDRGGLEWSAALYPSGQPYGLATDAASLLCFSGRTAFLSWRPSVASDRSHRADPVE